MDELKAKVEKIAFLNKRIEKLKEFNPSKEVIAYDWLLHTYLLLNGYKGKKVDTKTYYRIYENNILKEMVLPSLSYCMEHAAPSLVIISFPCSLRYVSQSVKTVPSSFTIAGKPISWISFKRSKTGFSSRICKKILKFLKEAQQSMNSYAMS